MSIYKWAPGAQLSEKKLPAQVAGEALEQLQRDNGGRMTPRMVVEAAEPEDAPLHPAFDWDNERAAAFWRDEQARSLVSHIRVEYQAEVGGASELLHAFVSVSEPNATDGQDRAYVPLARVLSEPALLQQAMMRAAAELKSMESRYREFKSISKAIRAAREQVESAA